MKVYFKSSLSLQTAWIAAASFGLTGLTHGVSYADAYSETCGDQIGSKEVSQKSQHCQTAALAKQGSTAHDMSGHLWQAVVLTCVITCRGDSPSKYASPCGQAEASAGVATGVMAHDIQSSFAAATEAGAGVLTGGDATTAAPPTENSGDGADPAPKKKDKNGCMQTIISSFKKATEHAKQKDQNNSAFDRSIDNAKNLAGNEPTNVNAPGGDNVSTEPTGIGSAATAGEVGSETYSPTGACGVAHSSGNLSSYLPCARRADPALPSFAVKPEFADDFKKLTGQALNQFLAKQDRPSQNIASGAAGSIGNDAALKMGTELASLEDHYQQSAADSTATYSANGGSGSRGGTTSAEPSVSDLMTGFLGQVNGGKNGEATTALNADLLNFSKAYRSPATVAENRALSIFDRVSYRYQFVITRMR